MTIDVSLEVLVGASLFMGAQLAMLGQVVKSNRDQGRRLGELEGWRRERKGAATERKRVNTDTRGVPTREE